MVILKWRPAYAGILFFQILLLTDLSIVGLAKRGGGGGAGRGAKTGTGSRGSANTGVGRASQPSYPKSSAGGTYSAGSYGNKKPGSSIGSGGSWKTHAAAGVAGAVLGAAVSHQLTKSYYKYGYGGRDYYYGDRYYRQSQSYSKKCVYSLTENDFMKYDDGYTVKEIVFECNARTEHCCGMECCSNSTGMPWWGILLAIFALICLVATCVFLGMKYRKRPNTFSNAATTEASVPLHGNTDEMSAAKAYTAQTGYYAGGPTYPAYPQGPGSASWQQPSYPQYPQAAPPYGFNAQQTGPYVKQY